MALVVLANQGMPIETPLAVVPKNRLDKCTVDYIGVSVVFPCILGDNAWFAKRNNESLSRRFDGMPLGRLVLSPTGIWFAAVSSVNEKYQVVSSDTTGSLYDKILTGTLSFAKEGSQVYYAAQVNGKWFSVIDTYRSKTVVSNPYDQIRPGSFTISPDGRYVAFAALQGDAWGVSVIDRLQERLRPNFPSLRMERMDYQEVGTIVFSPNNTGVTYTARINNSWRIYRDGNALQPYDAIRGLTISVDGRTTAYTVEQQRKWYLAKYAPLRLLKQTDAQGTDLGDAVVYAESKSEMAFDELGQPVISPDSARIAVAARSGEKWQIVVAQCVGISETAGNAYEAVGVPQFSKDGKHLVYTAQIGGKWAVIYDGKTLGPPVDEIGMPVFSPDGSRVIVSVRQGQKWSVMVDGKVGIFSKGIGSYSFSTDGTHVGYVSIQDDGVWVVVDDKRYGPYAGILDDAIFSETPVSFHMFAYREPTSGKSECKIVRVTLPCIER